MAQPILKERLYTPDEYLELEERAETRSEYWNGRIYAMSGGTLKHDLITGNIYAAMHTALRGRKCVVLTANMKVSIRDDGPFVYPDVSAVCGRPRFARSRRDLIANPDVVVEVLSPSTKAYDLGDKAEAYRRMPSVKDVVFVAQDRTWIQVLSRLPDNSWRLVETTDPTGSVRLESIDCNLDVADVYALDMLDEVIDDVDETEQA